MVEANRENVMTHEEKVLSEIVAGIIDNRRSHVRINPAWIATEALLEIDPDRASIELVRTGCHLQLRQIARAMCSKLFEEKDDDDEEPIFDSFDNLQWRYPTARRSKDTEPQYVLRDMMSDADIRYNVMRLRREANAKLAHADLLAAWAISRGVAV